jgi:hypothetical protein
MTLRAIENSRTKAYLKGLLLPSGRAPRRIRSGLLAGLRMEIDAADQSQRWLGLQERELYGWFRRFSEGIQTAIDVGANDGMYTLYFLAKTPARRVYAFEPSAESRRQLQINLELNGFAETGRLELVPKKVGAAEAGDSTTLDALAERVIPPCLIKVDIDGGEVDLLRGAQRLLRRPQMRWVIEVHSKKLQERCAEVLTAENYRTRVVPNAWWRILLPELRPGELNHWLVAVSPGSKEES